MVLAHKSLLRKLNLEGSVHDKGQWDSISDLCIGNGHVLLRPSHLFRKVDDEAIESYKDHLSRSPELEDILK